MDNKQQPVSDQEQNIVNPYPNSSIGQNSSVSGYSEMLVGSQLPPDKKRISRKLIIKSFAAFVLIVAIFVALISGNVLHLTKFKSITYDNGKGTDFKLKFYSSYILKNVSPTTQSSSSANGLNELVSKVSADSKYPLTLWIESNNSSDLSFKYNDCTKDNLPKAFDVSINYINKTVPVCNVNFQGAIFAYMAMFHDSRKNYLMYVSQDLNFQKILSNSQAAQGGLAKIGVDVYQDDLQTIIASIKPVN